MSWQTCPVCKGRGSTDLGSTCKTCQGSGILNELTGKSPANMNRKINLNEDVNDSWGKYIKERNRFLDL